ncbi:MAG: hypothetical protein Tsb0021_12740 [Chlamydiales bacterium]
MTANQRFEVEEFLNRLNQTDFFSDPNFFSFGQGVSDRYNRLLGPQGNAAAQQVITQGTARTFNEFYNQLAAQASQLGGSPSLPLFQSPQNVVLGEFLLDFMITQGIQPASRFPPPANAGEWTIFEDSNFYNQPAEILLNEGGGNRNENRFIQTLMARAFGVFLQTRDVSFRDLPNPTGNVLEDFHQQWNRFLTPANILMGQNAPDAPIGFFNINGSPSFSEQPSGQGYPGSFAIGINTYRNLYFAFVPNATEQDYEASLNRFFDNQINEHGYFLPGHFADEWFETVLTERVGIESASTLVDGTGSEQTRIIFEVFRLLTEMLTTLQRVAAVQAQRLTFLANMQRAYTELIAQIPNVAPDDIAEASDDISTEDQQGSVQQFVQNTTQAYTEKLRSFRSFWSDEARSHQTAVNQTNENVQQQANLATALLSQVSTILGAIFR